MKKFILPIIAAALICFGLVGTTYAWLGSRADPVVNTFVSGNITVSLVERAGKNPVFVPGAAIHEKPEAIVRADSEDCWLFVKVIKLHNFDKFLSYEIADGWAKLEGVSGDFEIYYRQVASSNVDQRFDILEGNQVVANSDNVTKADYDNVDSNNYPTLTFTAYGVQTLGFETAAAAWVEAAKLETLPPSE